MDTNTKTNTNTVTNGAIKNATLGAKDIGLTSKKTSSKKSTAGAFAIWVRVLLQNSRQGTVGVKRRSDVSYSTKKPWKQKGTGRARAGSRRSPLWRGGGVIFGPSMRSKTLKLTKSVKKNVLREMLLDLFSNNKVSSLNFNSNLSVPSTKAALECLKTKKFEKQSVTLLVSYDDILVQRSFINLPNVNLVLFDQLNAVNLASVKNLVCLEKDLDKFKAVVSQWL